MLTGDLAVALDAYRGVAALAAPGDPAGLAVATANLALTLAYAGDEGAAGVAEEAVAAALASANPTAIAMARFAEGEAFADADPARAAAVLDEALRRAREVGNRFVAGTALTAMVALRAGTAPRSRRWPVPGRDRPLADQPQPPPPGHHPAQPGRPACPDRPGRGRRELGRDLGGGGPAPVLRRRGGPDGDRPHRRAAPPRPGRLRARLGGRDGPGPRGRGQRRQAPARPAR